MKSDEIKNREKREFPNDFVTAEDALVSIYYYINETKYCPYKDIDRLAIAILDKYNKIRSEREKLIGSLTVVTNILDDHGKYIT